MKNILAILVMITLFLFSCSNGDKEIKEDVRVYSKYISNELVDSVPQVFMEGFISNELAERDAAFSPDMKSFYYTVWLPIRKGVIMQSICEDSIWTKPKPAWFSGVYDDLEPAFSPDGKRLYFVSDRPIHDSAQSADYNIWFVEKTDTVWSDPILAGKGINTKKNEFYPSISNSGTVYFTRNLGKEEKLFQSPVIDGKHDLSFALSDTINFSKLHYNAYIDPDEKFIIYSAWPGRNDKGGGDLYISFNLGNKSWSSAENIQMPINSPYLDYCPYITPDGKYFFFTSGRVTNENIMRKYYSMEDLRDLNSSIGNGFSDIYWVKADFIRAMN